MKEKRSTKAKSKQLAQVTIVAKSLVCDASLAQRRSSPCDSKFRLRKALIVTVTMAIFITTVTIAVTVTVITVAIVVTVTITIDFVTVVTIAIFVFTIFIIAIVAVMFLRAVKIVFKR